MTAKVRFDRVGTRAVLTVCHCLLAAVCLSVSRVRADELAPYKRLLENSPFLTPAFKAQLARRDRTSIRFLGYTLIGEVWYFALFDGKLDKTYWLTMDVEEDNIRVDKFDEKSEQLHVTVDGISFVLHM